jgi:organic hydroperoxide reductase OsmC/OhrA
MVRTPPFFPRESTMAAHNYNATITWTGAAKGPTANYASFSRDYTATISGKAVIKGSADPSYKGDPALHNPEDMLLMALGACHMLTYLAYAALKKVVVVSYEDAATGTLEVERTTGQFKEVVLHPVVTIAKGSDAALAQALHEDAHRDCFIARSVNFTVRHEPKIVVQES